MHHGNEKRSLALSMSFVGDAKQSGHAPFRPGETRIRNDASLFHASSAWSGLRHSQPDRIAASAVPSSWAATNAATASGAMPANVFDSERASVTAGLAKDVEAVNQ